MDARHGVSWRSLGPPLRDHRRSKWRRARLRSRTRGRVFGWIRWSPLVPWLELAQPDCVPVFPRPELPHGTRLRTQECPGKTEKDPS